MNIIDAIQGRYSARAFLDQDVDTNIVRSILDCARWAPSGVNIQPWQVAVVRGKTKKRISEAMLTAFDAGEKARPDYSYYPEQWFEPYKSRRFACGMALYGALDIKRDDKQRRRDVWMQNYRFFDAPVGLFCYIDSRLETGAWMDMGMFLQNIMLAARSFGLETCPQAAMAEYPDLVKQLLNLPENTQLVCGIALGYADKSHPVNQYRTERETVDNFTQWYE